MFPSSNPNQSMQAETSKQKFPWVSIAPFGVPIVPEV